MLLALPHKMETLALSDCPEYSFYFTLVSPTKAMRVSLRKENIEYARALLIGHLHNAEFLGYIRITRHFLLSAYASFFDFIRKWRTIL